uniref:Sterile alpha motif domain-containing protein 5 n=1 Tax=Timema genevievae TaxID=629358 RepID=A0A7R9K2K1_TIMGE|nr:unnamed protein product [Timema genevievae]
MSSNSNIVVEWLRSLHLGQYAESFIDNGYDDLEICKQVGDPDLDAIGVFNPAHRSRLLHSVRTLREEGAASVYFTLEETAALHDECQCDSSSARSSRTSSGHQGSSDKDNHIGQRCGTGNSPASSSAESAQELGKYLDEYEEGKAELVKIPRIQLKLLVKEKLAQDGIRLSCQPYSTSARCPRATCVIFAVASCDAASPLKAVHTSDLRLVTLATSQNPEQCTLATCVYLDATLGLCLKPWP